MRSDGSEPRSSGSADPVTYLHSKIISSKRTVIDGGAWKA